MKKLISVFKQQLCGCIYKVQKEEKQIIIKTYDIQDETLIGGR